MKKLVLLIPFLFFACSANYHLRRAQYHERMAYALGAEVKNDTVYKEVEVITAAHEVDSLANVQTFRDTIYITSEKIKTEVKVNVKEKKVFVHTVCLPDTIKIKQPIYITKTLKTEAKAFIKWWWLLIAAGLGFIIKPLIKLFIL